MKSKRSNWSTKKGRVLPAHWITLLGPLETYLLVVGDYDDGRLLRSDVEELHARTDLYHSYFSS